MKKLLALLIYGSTLGGHIYVTIKAMAYVNNHYTGWGNVRGSLVVMVFCMALAASNVMLWQMVRDRLWRT